MSSPLSHIRVLDLSRQLAGPWSAQMLADFGADVIKVERPKVGDDMRHYGPPWVKDPDGNDTEECPFFLAANRGKRSVTIDIGSKEGQELIRRMVAHCDVVIENYRVGTLQRYGLGYEDLKKIKPDLVYCSITGFGQDGPYKDRAGYDSVLQAMSGIMSITGEPDDQPGGGPQKTGMPVSDFSAGLYASVSMLAALMHRERTGEGQYIDIALLDTSMSLAAGRNPAAPAAGRSAAAPGPHEPQHGAGASLRLRRRSDHPGGRNGRPVPEADEGSGSRRTLRTTSDSPRTACASRTGKR